VNPCLLGLSNSSIRDAEKANVKIQLMSIPTDPHLDLFKQLSPITSACLGLTCKVFYGIHWSLHGKVGLEEEDEQSNSCLAFSLQSWIAPLVLSGHAGIPKFIPVEAVKLQREEFPKEERLAIAEYWERVKAARRLGGHMDGFYKY